MSDGQITNELASTLVGSVLGNYRITGELSTGGMGAVYRAEHVMLGRPAAVKLLRPELTANPELVTRFFNEAKAATAIRHPGIIEVFDFGYAEDGRAYIVMEFLDGEPLSKRLEDRGRLSEVEAAHITRGIASALTAAHKRGIVHRDLKPDNVFLIADPDLPNGERAKVLDFGIAKLADPAPSNVKHTQTGALMGTPLYMAPEQARAAGEIDHRADLYSLGCILYELLTGTPPFVAEGAGEIIALQLFGQHDSLRTRLDTVSPQIEEIVERLLEKEPKDRFQSAAELSKAIDGMLGRFNSAVSNPSLHAASTPRPKLTLSSRAGASPRVESEIPQIRATIEYASPRRNTMALVAGLITLAIAAAAVAVFALRSSDDDDKPAPAKLESAPPAPPPSTPTPPAPPSTPPTPVVEETRVEPPAPPRPQPPKQRPVRVVAPKPPDGKPDEPKKHTDKGSPIEITP